MPTLKSLGWNDHFSEHFAPYREFGYIPGRVLAENRANLLVVAEDGEFFAEPSGKMRFSALSSGDLPKVGDWTALARHDSGGPGIIHAVLPRSSLFSRKTSGVRIEEQVIAANADILFIVQGLDGDFNIRRLERYLVMAYESGAAPVIVLNKADIRPGWESAASQAETVAPGVPVIAASARSGMGIDRIGEYLREGVTAALIGSSGVGKSTFVNILCGREIQATRDVRLSDSRGRHATTRRELIFIPGGGMLIDTPGMRELGIINAEDGIGDAFSDISATAVNCRYADCTHTVEPGCAVLSALETGELDHGRYRNWLKLRKEQTYLASKQEFGREKELRFKKIRKLSREFYRIKGKK